MENSYNIETLFDGLGIDYKNMTGSQIADVFVNKNLKVYLGKKVTDPNNKHLFNVSLKPTIYFGDTITSKLSVTDMNKIFKDIYLDTEYQPISRNLIMYSNPEEITIDISIASNSNINDLRVFRLLAECAIKKDKNMSSLEARIISELLHIKEQDIELYNRIINGDVIVNLNVYVNDKEIPYIRVKGENNEDSKEEIVLDKLYSLSVKYKEFEKVFFKVNSFGGNNFYSTYKWARDIIHIGEKAYIKFFTENKDTVYSSVEERNKAFRYYARKELIANLGIKPGRACLFSVGKFNEVKSKIQKNVIYIEKDVQEDSSGKLKAVYKDILKTDAQLLNIFVLNEQSFFLGYIRKVTKDYVWVAINYKSSDKVLLRCLPIRWELLLPDISIYESVSGLSSSSVMLLRGTPQLQQLFSIISDTVILLTEQNCFSLKHPNEQVIVTSEHNFGKTDFIFGTQPREYKRKRKMTVVSVTNRNQLNHIKNGKDINRESVKINKALLSRRKLYRPLW